MAKKNNEQKLFNSVTDTLLKELDNRSASRSLLTGIPAEQPLEVEHPAMDAALMYAQPGSLLTKLMAPSVYRGVARGLSNGDGVQALIYGLVPETNQWVEISKRAAELQEGNAAKYSQYKAVGIGERLPRQIASRKANLVEKGITPDGEPYVIRRNVLADPNETLRKDLLIKTIGEDSGPAEWANTGIGSRVVRGHADGGGIHIKPSHRGRLTELKERTGKSEAELYNDGNPAHKKMVVFARNARKWNKMDLGGKIQKLAESFNGDYGAMLQMFNRLREKKKK